MSSARKRTRKLVLTPADAARKTCSIIQCGSGSGESVGASQSTHLSFPFLRLVRPSCSVLPRSSQPEQSLTHHRQSCQHRAHRDQNQRAHKQETDLSRPERQVQISIDVEQLEDLREAVGDKVRWGGVAIPED